VFPGKKIKVVVMPVKKSWCLEKYCVGSTKRGLLWPPTKRGLLMLEGGCLEKYCVGHLRKEAY
jgi:hypothetical protein